ncbi:MAG: UTP--glucose-1-phosphate uridylyltransferase [Candidatus Paceibacterota bacterium]
MSDITKAVIAAAGYGTRFLPATKNQPKEMLPLVDKPIIHYLVEEAVDSGIEDIIMVTRSGRSTMEEYFDSNSELERELEEAGKYERLEKIKEIPKMANFVYVRQHDYYPYGNATPIKACSHLIDDDEAFVYMFGDDLTISEKPVTKQLINLYEKENPSAVLGVQKVPDEEVKRYGTVKYKEEGHEYEIEAGYEKLPAEEAPSNMAQFGRFVFSYDVVEQAEETPVGKDNELWVMDILNELAHKEQVLAKPIEGEWHTTGDPLRYLKTLVEFSLEREDLGDKFKDYLKKRIEH